MRSPQPTAAALTLLAPLALFTLVSVSAPTAPGTPWVAASARPAAEVQGGKDLLPASSDARPTITPSSTQVTVAPAETGFTATIAPGADQYPGIRLTPRSTPPAWDLSAFGHVEAVVVNTGAKPLTLSLRVDNAGNWQDNPWNTETITLEPGARGTLTTLFGYSYGRKPGYRLNPKAVVGVLFFAAKSDAPQSFRVESLRAAGLTGEKPPVAPEDVRVRPVNGNLMGVGTRIQVLRGLDGGLPPIAGVTPFSIHLPASASAIIRPAAGRWDLRDCLEVRVRVRNTGTVPVTLRVRVDSNGGPREAASTPFAPGATATVIVPFIPPVVPDLGKPETVARFTSDAVSAITVRTDTTGEESSLLLEAVTADMPPAPKLPDWLGKRPPVPGDWVKTLDDEFDGNALNTRIWDPEGENYYDQVTHWSKKNVLVGGGVVRLRYEKKTGYQNDDPTKKQTAYAAGYLNTYGKWTQRYGYFEARVKLPNAPGLWPAFWMMPERGVAAGPEQWKRQDTANGGMEFDIMEHLTRWGPTRYNIAMHWDGYGKDHKSNGTDAIYAPPDKDGFITVGLLWTPGLAVYYANGREVLRWQNPRISNVPSALMFTLPSGGWDNNALDDARLPADFTMDYVRVWQRSDLTRR